MSEVPDYTIQMGEHTTIQNTMFNRADMSYWGFTASDVAAPDGCELSFDTPSREPVFVSKATGEEIFHGELRRVT